MGMNLRIEPVLYIDEQAAVPAGCCLRCGGAVYFPDKVCIRCEADDPA